MDKVTNISDFILPCVIKHLENMPMFTIEGDNVFFTQVGGWRGFFNRTPFDFLSKIKGPLTKDRRAEVSCELLGALHNHQYITGNEYELTLADFEGKPLIFMNSECGNDFDLVNGFRFKIEFNESFAQALYDKGYHAEYNEIHGDVLNFMVSRWINDVFDSLGNN